MRTTSTVFPYFWHWDDNEKEVTVFRIYALTKDNKTVVLRINDFTPYCFLELPEKVDGVDIKWDASKAQLLSNAINGRLKSHGPIKTSVTKKKRLYYCN